MRLYASWCPDPATPAATPAAFQANVACVLASFALHPPPHQCCDCWRRLASFSACGTSRHGFASTCAVLDAGAALALAGDVIIRVSPTAACDAASGVSIDITYYCSVLCYWSYAFHPPALAPVGHGGSRRLKCIIHPMDKMHSYLESVVILQSNMMSDRSN